MQITTVLFDLDGTLLPMDQEEFTRAYFKRLAAKLASHGYEPQKLIDAIWSGTAAMVKNDGSRTNEEAFWARFAQIFGDSVLKDMPLFDDFYLHEFQQVEEICGKNPLAKEVIALVKSLGLRTALATNPIFPAYATESRIRWAGLEPADFEFFTNYTNSCHCKPNPAYYQDILNRLNCQAEECLMVGNDVGEDMIAETLGMKVFLLTDCLINKSGAGLSRWPHGDFRALMEYLRALVRT